MNDSSVVIILLIASAFFAGAINSLAGGGTLLTFPVLLAALSVEYGDRAGAVANATSTLALMPGAFAGAWGYRKELRESKAFAMTLVWPSLIGGLVGSLLVILWPERFASLVPWLLLSAAVLFLIQPSVNRYLNSRRPDSASANPATKIAVIGLQFLVAVYGGYFGAGIGILMLSALGFLGLVHIYRANAVKTFLSSCINAVAAFVFIATGWVDYPRAGLMAVAAIAGGYAGARLGRRLPKAVVRWVVIAIAFGLAGYYAWQQFGAKSS